MKKIISILILITYLCSFTELTELLKCPSLLIHYSEHNRQNKNLSFSDFLFMHYQQAHDNDGDDEADKHLPFKSHDNCIYTSSFNLLAQTNTIVHIKPVETELHEVSLQEQQFFYPSFSSNIWQPPKL